MGAIINCNIDIPRDSTSLIFREKVPEFYPLNTARTGTFCF
ncbi:hypothetical protein VL20_31 [Microcystis panniformis FACHB-1757]|uniref:Uncharacterized protein n=1 Tax=Microcystis panniformis FACHB-1757 TaxID=1638788 RepID=A0A0K1RU35_9CHRO|nr:hypothetical protein VL20_31 [Microcystis panniformis FACHB-1757]